MLWELLTYVVLPLIVIVLIRRRRARRLSGGVHDAKGFSSDIVLITGGAQGIGRQLAYKFGQRGAKLVLWDFNEAKLQSTRQELEDTGYVTYAYTVDCSDKEAVLAAATKVKEEVGDVTVLVNNAGTFAGKTILQMEDDDFEKTMKINVYAHFWATRAFLPSMLGKNHGYIISVASAAAFTTLPCMSDYSASKAAALSFAKSLQAEIILAKKSGVTVTCICPGSINTAFGDRFKKVPDSIPKIHKHEITVEAAVDRIMEAVVNREFVVVFPRTASVVGLLSVITPRLILRWLARRSKNYPAIDLATGKDKV